MSQVGGERILHRVSRHVLLERTHPLHEVVDDAARVAAGKSPRQPRAVVRRRQQPALVFGVYARFGAGKKRRAQLNRLRAERKGCRDAAPVHDAAGGDERDLYRIGDLRHERHQADRGILEVAEKRAAVPTCLETLRADEIGTGGFARTRFGGGGGSRDHDAAGALEQGNGLRIEQIERKAHHRRFRLQQGIALRAVVFAEAGRERGGIESQLPLERREALRGLGQLRFRGMRGAEHEEIHIERLIGERAYAGDALLDRRRRRHRGAEGAERPGVADRRNQFRRGCAASHGRLDDRIADSDFRGEARGKLAHAPIPPCPGARCASPCTTVCRSRP